MRVILLGPPGAGKGTLAEKIKEKFDIVHVSTGDIFREEMKSNSPLGKEIKGYVESGKLVPDDVVTKIVENKLVTDKRLREGFLLDGFPRTQKQAEDLDKILERLKSPIHVALYMEAGLPTIIQRLTGRRVCKKCGALYHATNKPPKVAGKCDKCGGEIYQRPDDNEETIRTRMDVYLKNTKPIVEYYEKAKKLLTVNSEKPTETVLNHLVERWNEHTATDKH